MQPYDVTVTRRYRVVTANSVLTESRENYAEDFFQLNVQRGWWAHFYVDGKLVKSYVDGVLHTDPESVRKIEVSL